MHPTMALPKILILILMQQCLSFIDFLHMNPRKILAVHIKSLLTPASVRWFVHQNHPNSGFKKDVFFSRPHIIWLRIFSQQKCFFPTCLIHPFPGSCHYERNYHFLASVIFAGKSTMGNADAEVGRKPRLAFQLLGTVGSLMLSDGIEALIPKIVFFFLWKIPWKIWMI